MSTSPAIPSAPGPRPMRGLGAVGNVLRYAYDPIGTAGRLFARYGDVVSLVRAPVRMVNPGPGWGPGAAAAASGAGIVLVNGAALNREILTRHERYHMISLSGRLYPTGVDVNARRRPLLRTMTGLFHVNEGEHRRHRRLLMPAFHKTRIEAYRDDMVGITGDLLRRYRPGEVRDVHADMTELTLRIATKTLFGEDEGERGLRLAKRMQQWLATMFSPLTILARVDLPGLPYRQFLSLTADIDRETVAIVRDRRARGPREGADRSTEHRSAVGHDPVEPERAECGVLPADLLSALLAARDEEGAALDEDELIGHTGVIFAAGHETSTNALVWTLLLLSQHPEIARHLDDELHGVLRGAPPTVADLARLPLLDAVVKESLRVLPPVPLHPRIVAEDHELAGHHLPAGSELFLSIYHMHHDPDVFPDARRFHPRRWETAKPTVYEYNPFSAGPRMCIGASFATMEIKIVLASLLQQFQLELPARSRVDPRVAITMAPSGGLPMRVRRRGERPRAGGVRGRVRALVRLPE